MVLLAVPAQAYQPIESHPRRAILWAKRKLLLHLEHCLLPQPQEERAAPPLQFPKERIILPIIAIAHVKLPRLQLIAQDRPFTAPCRGHHRPNWLFFYEIEFEM
jgi:hypothetical protein